LFVLWNKIIDEIFELVKLYFYICGMEKIIHTLIDSWVKGVDTYTHNDSTWLIFTDSKKWVVELTKEKTLWYNYNFFKQIFEFVSLEVVDNQDYITKWVEDNVINKVKEIKSDDFNVSQNLCEDVIENGVKKTNVCNYTDPKTQLMWVKWGNEIDNVIESGIKRTLGQNLNVCHLVDDTIENGVNHTEIGWHQCNNVDDTIEKGVRETMFNQGHRQPAVKNIIENGVRETNHVDVMGFYNTKMEDVLENGVKKTQGTPGWTHEPKTSNVIDNGIKETKTPGEDGDIVGYLEWVDDKTIRKFPEIINDIIDNGIKETNSWNESIIGDLNQNGCIDNVIKEGVKETKGDASQNPMGKVTKVIKEGIKNPTY